MASITRSVLPYTQDKVEIIGRELVLDADAGGVHLPALSSEAARRGAQLAEVVEKLQFWTGLLQRGRQVRRETTPSHSICTVPRSSARPG